MHENIQEKPSLLLITDTFLKYDKDMKPYALEPVQREVDHFAHLFGTVTWIGYDWTKVKPGRFLSKVVSDNIEIIKIEGVGGRNFIKKIHAFLNGIFLIPTIIKQVRKHDVIHTRGPSVPALMGVLISFFYRKKNYWNKYAGNWNQEHPPFSYALLRTLLRKATFSKVTINGKWPQQPSHCLSFENPCLTDEELSMGMEVMNAKDYTGKLNFCFVGRVETAKGVGRILDMLKEMGENSKIGEVHIIGDGPEREGFMKLAETIPHQILFHGYMSRSELVEILKSSHLFLLPSTASEGFPKVIAESANYGCIPFVSNVSSIAQYIVNGENGWVLDNLSVFNMVKNLNEVLDQADLKNYAYQIREMLQYYTYSFYAKRIKEEII